MIHVEVEQGTPEWRSLRAGIPTASAFEKIITPTGKASSQAEGYLCKLLAEWMGVFDEDEFTSDWMARGYMTQPEAVNFYEFQTGNKVMEAGFCYKDETRMVGASPDGFAEDESSGTRGGVEVKCFASANHMRTLLNNSVTLKYIPQVQGSLWVTGLAWWDFVAYHPELPSTIIRVYPDMDYHKRLDDYIGGFLVKMKAARSVLLDRGFGPGQGASQVASSGELGSKGAAKAEQA